MWCILETLSGISFLIAIYFSIPHNRTFNWWAHLGSNQGPTGYEPVALPTELWAPLRLICLSKR